MKTSVLMDVDLGLQQMGTGKEKIRKMYRLPSNRELGLMIPTDRISAFDVVMETGIPQKGIVLNNISAFWFEQTKNICPNHLVSTNIEEFPKEAQDILYFHKELLGRVSLIRIADFVFPIECIVRGYITGSGYREYQETGEVCGIELPEGLQKGDRLPAPIFTPSTKAPAGQHDENITFQRMAEKVGEENAAILRAYSLSLFCFASNYLALKGVRLVDTKFEFGLIRETHILEKGKTFIQPKIILIDELFTPDSSRFDPELTKQPFRDWLEKIGFDKKTPIKIPPEVVERTRRDYLEAHELITGKKI